MLKNETISEGIKLENNYKGILCPKCKEIAKIIVNNYKLDFNGCKNGHCINDVLINDFKTTRYITEKKIICENCKEQNTNISNNNAIYLCLKCNQILCEKCKSIHDKTHNIINYQAKYFICYLHFEPYNSYCSNCKKDLCKNCENEHKWHKIIPYEEVILNASKEKGEDNIFFDKKEALKKDIKDIINKLFNLISSIDNCFDIYEDITKNNIEKNRQNYFLLHNLIELKKLKNVFISDMNKIIDEKNLFNKVNYMIDLYNKMNLSNDIYYKTEQANNTTDLMYNLIKMPEIKNEKEKLIFIGNRDSDDLFIDKTIETNSEYMLLSEDNEDNDYKNFDFKKMKKLLKLKNEKFNFKKIYALKDGRIIAHNGANDYNEVFLCFLFDLKNDKCFYINIKNLFGLCEMDDDIILISADMKLMLIDIKKPEFEIIQILKIQFPKILKLSNEKILIKIANDFGNIYIYKNKNLVLEKQIKLNSLKNIDFNKYISINEKEIAVEKEEKYLNSNENDRYLYFFDLEKDKKIKSFQFEAGTEIDFDLFNNKVFIIGNKRKILIIDLTSHSKKNSFSLPEPGNIHSIIVLNYKKFIACQVSHINLFEFDKDYKFNLINKVSLSNEYIIKYPKSRFLIREQYNEKTFYLYG